MKCEWCDERQAQALSDCCLECELEVSAALNDNYKDWIISNEYYSDGSVYHTCKRCGELVNGINASVVHWEKKHLKKLYPDGFSVEVVKV